MYFGKSLPPKFISDISCEWFIYFFLKLSLCFCYLELSILCYVVTISEISLEFFWKIKTIARLGIAFCIALWSKFVNGNPQGFFNIYMYLYFVKSKSRLDYQNIEIVEKTNIPFTNMHIHLTDVLLKVFFAVVK